MQLYSRDIW